MIFDTWGGVLTGRDYQHSRSITCIKLLMVYCVKTTVARASHAVYQRRRTVAGSDGRTGCDALGLDWTTDIADARRRWAIKSRCRVIWIRRCCTRRRPH